MNSEIDGVNFTDLKEISDNRGSVLHMIRSDSKDFENFGECYFSEILLNKIKAWKRHSIQIQNITVPVGKIILVIYDLRKNSNTFKNLIVSKIGRPNNYKRVKIPPGVWYGFKCVGESNALIVNCTNVPHDKNESEIIDYDDKQIPYNW
tara:strand:+ start:68 stop:514 length:447 start_codon:yes stop_codon:yes gene_type:complete